MIDPPIDKDFKTIIPYLNSHGFRTYACCDGVLANHSDKKNVFKAYIAFLHSDKILDLMAAFYRDKQIFNLSLSSPKFKKPYTYFNNLIEGNTYTVYFTNSDGNLTHSQNSDTEPYFQKIIQGICENKIKITEEERNLFEKINNAISNDESSKLSIELYLNTTYQPFMKKYGNINVLTISWKEGFDTYKDMYKIIDSVKKHNISETVSNNNIKDMFECTDFSDDEFTMLYDSCCNLYFSDEHLNDIIELINYIKNIENDIPDLPFPKSELDESYYDDYDLDY